MADSNVPVTGGSGYEVDTRTEATSSQHRQVIVLGDQSVTDALADVKHADPSSSDGGLVVRDPNSTAIVSGLRDVRVQSLVDGTVTVENITRVKNVVDGTLSLVTRVDRVHNVVDGTIKVKPSQTGETLQDETLRVVHVADVAGSMNVTQFGGNNVVTPNNGIPAVNIYNTTSIFTVSGSVSGSYPSGYTLVSPSANASFKVFSVDIYTTAQDHIVVTLENGADSGPTEYWRAALQAPSQGIAGVAKQVTPPGHFFATGVSTTLAIQRDVDSLVHYAISYIKESA